MLFSNLSLQLKNSEDEFWLDETSKKVFPFCFMIFNATFWCYAFYGTQGNASFGAQGRSRHTNIWHSRAVKSTVKAKSRKLKIWVTSECEVRFFYFEFCTFVLLHTFSLTVNSFTNSYLLDSTRIEEIRSFEVKFYFE